MKSKIKRTIYSNTTNVKVKQGSEYNMPTQKSNSNTTNVKVKLATATLFILKDVIQIQPMLRLNR